MINPQLLDYIKQQAAHGLSREQIQAGLLNAGGWTLPDITEAFAAVDAAHTNAVSATGVSVSLGTVPTPRVKYAGFWIRFVAVVVDSLILIIPTIILQLLAFGSLVAAHSPGAAAQSISSLVILVVNFGYYIWMTNTYGATLGKMMVGIHVVSDDLKPLHLDKIIIRETIGKLASGIILCIGYIMAGFTQKKQALHDTFVHSVVVYKDPAKPHGTGFVVAVILAVILPIIAIVGILASVVLVSLGTARQKGADAATRSELSQIRSNVEVYVDSHTTDIAADNCNSGVFADETIHQIISVIKSTSVTCYATAEKTYAISANLQNDGPSIVGSVRTAGNYCVDSTGFAGNGSALKDASGAYCQATSK